MNAAVLGDAGFLSATWMPYLLAMEGRNLMDERSIAALIVPYPSSTAIPVVRKKGIFTLSQRLEGPITISETLQKKHLLQDYHADAYRTLFIR